MFKFNPFSSKFDIDTTQSLSILDNRYLNESANLSDLDSAIVARANLGLGDLSVLDSLAHAALTGIGSSDHHTKYTNAEAVAALAAVDVYVEKAGDTMTGDLGLQDDQHLYFDTAKTEFLKYSTDHGYLLIGNSGGNAIITAVNQVELYSNTGADGSGNWEPQFYFDTSGYMLVKNTTQGDAGNRNFRIYFTDGIGLRTNNNVRSAMIKADNIAASSKTFQFPNASGTLAILETAQTFTATQKFGGATNYLQISSSGVVTLAGTAKRYLTLRPEINVDEIKKEAVVDQVQIGVFFGYSLPIWAGDNHEELFFRQNVPGRWDGASNIIVHVLCCLALAETADETFKFQLSWNQSSEADVVPAATHDTTDEIIVVDGTQLATYELEFTIDYDVDVGDPIVMHDLLAMRLRRVASTGDEVDGEIVILDWHLKYRCDKYLKE